MLQPILHNAYVITKCRNRYYKLRKLLQNASLLHNAAEKELFFETEECQESEKDTKSTHTR